MNKQNYQILKVIDKTDNYYTPVKTLFDIPFRLLINGKSQMTGKTTVILNLLLNPQFGYDKMFEGENIHIFSNNSLDNKLKIMAEKLDIPEENMNEFDVEMIEDLYEDMEDSFKEETMDGQKPKNRLIIFDDCGYSGGLASYKKENIVDKLICQGRHLNVSQIYTSQKYSQCSTCLRTNITGAILFGTTQREVDQIADDMSMYEKKSDFIKMFRQITKKPRSFLVVNYSNPIEELYLDSGFQPIDWIK